MSLPKRYHAMEVEPRLEQAWQSQGVYHFQRGDHLPVVSIDTPPPTVSGNLHLGHVYSYTHADVMVRYFRMQGYNVFYPMGFDDNGLPTERLVEKKLGLRASELGRETFIEKCLELSEEIEEDYRRLWRRLGLSIDWRYTYRTIDTRSRRISQLSFIDLYRKGLVYPKSAPTIWCPECRTAIAQAELNDLDADSEFVTILFTLEDGTALPISTTRPELLGACVAVFIYPDHPQHASLVGQMVRVPFYNHKVPILSDPLVDPEKGTGVVMCCTFGDQTDVTWWHTHRLPLIEAVGTDGRMTSTAGELEGLRILAARKAIKQRLMETGLIIERVPTTHSLRVHERCDTPVEYIVTRQWFVDLLSHKEELLAAGEKIHWHPQQMHSRYRAWVENLSWDWCISRQRYYGVTFPVWTCKACGEIILAHEDDLPVDPLTTRPRGACVCGSTEFEPEGDVMDTWATSSLSPQIIGGWLDDPDLYGQVFPMTVRPQAHEIIRTWLFYTIVKSLYHFDTMPWSDALISGWGLAGDGMGKISKSRSSSLSSPLEMIAKYSADAVRYWATSTSPGKDSVISEEKIQIGARLVTKLWNVGRFSARFLEGCQELGDADLSPADRWILGRLQQLIDQVTTKLNDYEYAAAKSEIELFFWKDLADNYLEMAKQRLYASEARRHEGAVFALRTVLLALLKLLAPFLPFATEALYLALFAESEGKPSIHLAAWPQADSGFTSEEDIQFGEQLVEIAGAVRRFKSERSLSLGTELHGLQLAVGSVAAARFVDAKDDLASITRARQIDVLPQPGEQVIRLPLEGSGIQLGIIME